MEIAQETYHKEKKGLDLSKLEDMASFNRRLRDEKLNDYEEDKVDDGVEDEKVSNPGVEMSDSQNKRRNLQSLTNMKPEKDKIVPNDTVTMKSPSDNVQNDMVMPRRSLRLAAKKSQEIATLARGFHKIESIKKQYGDLKGVRVKGRMNEKIASPRLQRSSDAAGPRKGRESDRRSSSDRAAGRSKATSPRRAATAKLSPKSKCQ